MCLTISSIEYSIYYKMCWPSTKSSVLSNGSKQSTEVQKLSVNLDDYERMGSYYLSKRKYLSLPTQYDVYNPKTNDITTMTCGRVLELCNKEFINPPANIIDDVEQCELSMNQLGFNQTTTKK